jgi:hypothetical protein
LPSSVASQFASLSSESTLPAAACRGVWPGSYLSRPVATELSGASVYAASAVVERVIKPHAVIASVVHFMRDLVPVETNGIVASVVGVMERSEMVYAAQKHASFFRPQHKCPEATVMVAPGVSSQGATMRPAVSLRLDYSYLNVRSCS